MRVDVELLCRWHPTASVKGGRCARCGCPPSWTLVVDRGADRLAHDDQVVWRPFKTKREAHRAAAIARFEHASGPLAQRAELTLADFLDDVWLPTVRDRVSASTWHSYRSELHRHIIPRLGDTQLGRLKDFYFERLWPRLLDDGRVDGNGGLSPRTVGYLHFIVHRALEDAYQWTFIDNNPARAKPRLDKKNAGTRGVRHLPLWTPRQLGRFLDHTRTHRLAAAWRLAATAGLRRGEILGLSWLHVDLDSARLNVRCAYVTVDGHARLVGPASAHARRTVRLDTGTVEELARWKQRQGEEHETRRVDTHHGLVFTQPNGRPIDPDNFSKSFTRLVRQARLPRISLRDLRNLHGATLLAAGVEPDQVARRLGHHDGNYTLRVLRDLVDELHVTASAQLDDLPLPDELRAEQREAS